MENEVDDRFTIIIDVIEPSILTGDCRIRMSEYIDAYRQRSDWRIWRYDAQCLVHGHRSTVSIDRNDKVSIILAEQKAINRCQQLEENLSIGDNRQKWLDWAVSESGSYTNEQISLHREKVEERMKRE